MVCRGKVRTRRPAPAPNCRERLASDPSWPRSSPSMPARPACAPSSSTSEARVADLAYRELTQHFPRPGWVEHDPGEIWAAVRATLAEVGARLAASGDTVAAIGITNQRETVVAFDRSTGQPLHRAIVWQDRRTAAICAELTEAGHLPLVRATTGLVLDPYFSATKSGLAAALGRSRARRRRPEALLLHRRHLGAVEPDRWHRRRRLRHRRVQRQPHPAPRHGDPRLVRRAVRPLRRAPADPARGAPVGRALRHRRARRPRPGVGVLDGVPVSGVLGDQQAALFGQACFEPGMVKVTYGTGSFVLANAGPERPARARRPHRQLRLGPRRRTPTACPPAWPTPSRVRRSCRAPPSSGCATVSASSSSVEEIGPLASSVPDSGGSPSCRPSPASAAPGGTRRPAAS